MDTRVTPQTIYNAALADTRRVADQLSSLQTQIATGKRFAEVSDDPTTMLTLLAQGSRARQIDTHIANVSVARSNLEISTSTLQQVTDLMSQARTLALEGSNSTNDANALGVLAEQVDALIERLVEFANGQNNGLYLFAGTAVQTRPYEVVTRNEEGQITDVRYCGADDATRTIVDGQQQLAIYSPGQDLFSAARRGATVFTGTTGAKPGAGTDSATGEAVLLLRHDATTFAPGSGVQAGTGTAADTLLGPAGSHRLHITDTSGTGVAGTVSLDGAPPIAFTNADTNLAVRNAAGDMVHLNMTSIVAGFDGDIDITATGSMSIDGGATFAPITYSASQVAHDSHSGGNTFVDTTLVRRVGSEHVQYTGTADAFQTLIALRDDLKNTRGLSARDQIGAVSARIADLDRMRNHLLEAVGSQSASLQSLDSLQSHLQDVQTAVQATEAELGDVDLTEVIVKLQSYQAMLTLSMQAFSRIVDQNLLDFLRN